MFQQIHEIIGQDTIVKYIEQNNLKRISPEISYLICCMPFMIIIKINSCDWLIGAKSKLLTFLF